MKRARRKPWLIASLTPSTLAPSSLIITVRAQAHAYTLQSDQDSRLRQPNGHILTLEALFRGVLAQLSAYL